MILLQVAADSVINGIPQIAGDAVPSSSPEIIAYLSVMLMPLIVLAIFSIVKYTVGVGIDNIDWVDLFAEMAIDLLSIFSSFVIGRYILETSSSSLLIGSFKVIGAMALGVILLCILRRCVIKERSTSTVRMSRVRLYIVTEYSIDIFCLILMSVL